MSSVYVKPSAGGRIRMPERNSQPMPVEGAWVVRRVDYYERLILSGDLIVCDPPQQPEAPAAEAPPAADAAPHAPAAD
ncbi:hypothetical protein [Bradyrhizobium sp. USDA 4350]